MSETRSEILTRIRQARQAKVSTPQMYSDIVRNYERQTMLSEAQVLDLFEDRLRDYGSGVSRCAGAELPEAIATATTARGITRLLVPSDVPRGWLPSSVAFVEDQQLSYEEMERVSGVLTRCALAIAETGTIVLRHNEHEGRRALSLIPDYHLCLVTVKQVVATVVEGMRQCAAHLPMPLTTISGPSATSDIEMTRIKGVHGPRVLDVILVDIS